MASQLRVGRGGGLKQELMGHWRVPRCLHTNCVVIESECPVSALHGSNVLINWLGPSIEPTVLFSDSTCTYSCQLFHWIVVFSVDNGAVCLSTTCTNISQNVHVHLTTLFMFTNPLVSHVLKETSSPEFYHKTNYTAHVSPHRMKESMSWWKSNEGSPFPNEG